MRKAGFDLRLKWSQYYNASVRIFFILATGLKGLPFTMPIAASCPRSSGSREVAGYIVATLDELHKRGPVASAGKVILCQRTV